MPLPPVVTPAAPAKPRRRVARPFTLPHFRRWASDLLLDTGTSWHLESFQLAFVEDLFSGCPECWLIIAEGNGKTTLLAGLALYHVEHRPFGAVPIAAASREQAEIMYRQAEGFVLRSESLHRPMHSTVAAAKGKQKTEVPRFTCLEGYRRINHAAGGRIQVLAADDATGDGVIPTLGIIDEPHRQKDLSLYRTWAGKLDKRNGQLVTVSTAGEPGSDFEETRERILASATEVSVKGSFTRAASDQLILHQWALPDDADPQDMRAVKKSNPFSGVTVSSLRKKRSSPTMTPKRWLRFTCNRPERDVECWLGPNADRIWADLAHPYEIDPAKPIFVGIDIALKQDTSAVVQVQRRPDGRWHATCRIWTPTEDRPVDVTDVMQHVRTIAKGQLISAAFDPRFFDVPAKMLGDEGLAMAEVTQSVDMMTTAVSFLYTAIMGGQITHDGDRAFSRQILNAIPRYNERAFTLAKAKSLGKIDAAVALAMAYDQALRHEAPEPSVYVERGLRTV